MTVMFISVTDMSNSLFRKDLIILLTGFIKHSLHNQLKQAWGYFEMLSHFYLIFMNAPSVVVHAFCPRGQLLYRI